MNLFYILFLQQAKQIDGEISNVIDEKKNMTTKLEHNKDLLKAKEASIPEVGKKIIEADIMKTHVNIILFNILQCLHLQKLMSSIYLES